VGRASGERAGSVPTLRQATQGCVVTMLAVGATALASWYGPGLYGNEMACGGQLTPHTNGVAHRTLPCGTLLRVCYRRRCARTRVVDRGPWVSGRTFDLCAGLAKRLHFGGVDVIHWGFA
jgi:rare lipoprotein A (peptidoglycan hydrolase)